MYLRPVISVLLDPGEQTARMKMQPLSILGGGAAGLALAHYAHHSGIPFLLYERLDRVGGLCLSYRLGEHTYDSGAHRFHDVDASVTRDVRSLVQLHPVTSPSRIYSAGQFVDFPPRLLNLLRNSSPAEWLRIGAGLWQGRRKRYGARNFQDFAISRFGERLARRFLLHYTAKVWGLPADRLSVDVATRRLNGLGLRALLFELFLPGRKVAHLDGNFLYPENGFGAIPEAIAARLPADSLRTRHNVSRLECKGRVVRRIHFTSGSSMEVPGLAVSTLPLNQLVQFLGPAVSEEVRKAARLLQFRQLRVIFLRLAKPHVSDNASIYFPDPGMCISRVSEPKNRSEALAPPEETSLVAEIPCSQGEALYALSEETLKDRVVSEICGTGLISPSAVLDWKHHLLPDAYPLYSLNYKQLVATIMQGLGEFTNLRTVGRNGTFFYSHLHDQLRMGRDFVITLSKTAGRQLDSSWTYQDGLGD